MLSLIRQLLPPLTVSKAEARQIARDLCRDRVWKADITLKEVHQVFRTYYVITRGWYGTNIVIMINGTSGRITYANSIKVKRASRKPDDEPPGEATAGVPRTPYPPMPVARNANKWPK